MGRDVASIRERQSCSGDHYAAPPINAGIFEVVYCVSLHSDPFLEYQHWLLCTAGLTSLPSVYVSERVYVYICKIGPYISSGSELSTFLTCYFSFISVFHVS